MKTHALIVSSILCAAATPAAHAQVGGYSKQDADGNEASARARASVNGYAGANAYTFNPETGTYSITRNRAYPDGTTSDSRVIDPNDFGGDITGKPGLAGPSYSPSGGSPYSAANDPDPEIRRLEAQRRLALAPYEGQAALERQRDNQRWNEEYTRYLQARLAEAQRRLNPPPPSPPPGATIYPNGAWQYNPTAHPRTLPHRNVPYPQQRSFMPTRPY